MVSGAMSLLDTKSIIRSFGGRTFLWRKLQANGHIFSIRTIDKWMENGITMKWFMVLKKLATSEGWELKLEDYIAEQKRKEHEVSPKRNDNGGSQVWDPKG